MDVKRECSISHWYPVFAKDALEARIVRIPEQVCKYLQHDTFILPVEASPDPPVDVKWADGTTTNTKTSEETAGEDQPSFPQFSQRLQQIIDQFGGVFVKTNWTSPSDATWVAPTKTLKCVSLEDIYLLLKSSDRICADLNAVGQLAEENDPSAAVPPCLVLKKWRDVPPSTEFRCFVVKNRLVGICQRDPTQYYRHVETEKYNIQRDIASLFDEKIKSRFKPDDYSFDVVRWKKDKVKIMDFGPLDESVTKNMLFTLEELHNPTSPIDDENPAANSSPEFRFIAENMGIQPTTNNHFRFPREINEYFRAPGSAAMIDMIQQQVENQLEI